ncbi:MULTISPECIES: Fic family protein [Halorhodospira]|uniref:Fic family protein n=1 Tax=Halorhodospira TaxID=85108 RepID=UPI001EE81F82|nr:MULTISPECIES: Fic family protein [Halorhodospira]MCG5529191.1 Fic family protein [Halorhodospira halophila]MCG5543118.1 Fic family protein [Halorhodospira sp. 9628]
MVEITRTPYEYEEFQSKEIQSTAQRVAGLREKGSLSPEVLHRIRRFFKIKNIYHSNAIEGNILDVGETRQVVEMGLTITGKPLKDQAEARNLSEALDFLEELAADSTRPIREPDIRQIHGLVLKGINDDEAGAYRTVNVEISGSEFAPPGPESLRAEMNRLGEWLSSASVPGELFGQEDALIAAAAAHTWFVTIHPFIDGNGRVGRLLMNLILMRYGYPIAIITNEDRLRYYDALETSQGSDLTGFISLLNESVCESLEEYERAAEEQREHFEWAESLAQKFSEPERVRAHNEYEVWKNAMELLKSYFRQAAELVDQADYAKVYFRDFGTLDFAKYSALRLGDSAKRTWFMRTDFRQGDRSARYLFFFGHASPRLRDRCDVTLFVAREEPEGSYHYERLDNLGKPNVPPFFELGYEMSKERFVVRHENRRTRVEKLEEIVKSFFEEVVSKHFSG